jgi:hypothetical protein
MPETDKAALKPCGAVGYDGRFAGLTAGAD